MLRLVNLHERRGAAMKADFPPEDLGIAAIDPWRFSGPRTVLVKTRHDHPGRMLKCAGLQKSETLQKSRGARCVNARFGNPLSAS